MSSYRYSDIPDDMITKQCFPMGRHLWRVYSELGPRYLMKWHMKYASSITELMEERLNSSVLTGKAMIEDRIKEPSKTLSFQFFPSFNMLRVDLLSGAMKQLFSESADCTFVMVDDVFQEVFFLINTHVEEGFPTNWWIADRNDEMLDLKDKNSGIPIKKLPKKLKNLQKSGNILLEILRNIRNKKNPEYTQSSYHIIIAYASNVANLICELSSYEVFSAMWDFFQMKMKYPSFKDFWGLFIPIPLFLKNLLYGGRAGFSIQMSKIMLDYNLALHRIENKWQNFLLGELPELWDVGFRRQIYDGVPTPKLTLECELPNLNDSNTINNEDFEFKYPLGEKITVEGLGISESEFLSGVYLNVSHETPKMEKITKKHIISTGLGKKAKIY
ncbi:MAG: hypothetical protein ACTSRG_14360 [Candidatus Helarchaeota archaeon]